MAAARWPVWADEGCGGDRRAALRHAGRRAPPGRGVGLAADCGALWCLEAAALRASSVEGPNCACVEQPWMCHCGHGGRTLIGQRAQHAQAQRTHRHDAPESRPCAPWLQDGHGLCWTGAGWVLAGRWLGGFAGSLTFCPLPPSVS